MPLALNRISTTTALAMALALTLSAAEAGDLPPVPDAIATTGVLRVGTKCDYPPYGFMDNAGQPQGVEVSLGKQIAAYALGDAAKAEIVCVTSANRIPSLVGGKVDLVIATMGINDKRKEVIDFTDPYSWGGSEVLVTAESPIKSLEELRGKTIVFLKGAWQIPWFEEKMPDVETLKLDTVSDALQALLQGRADAYAHDYTVLAGIAAKNDKIRLLGEMYQIGLTGAGVRKGETAWRDYATAAIEKAKNDGLTDTWIEDFVEPDLQQAVKDTWDLQKLPLQ